MDARVYVHVCVCVREKGGGGEGKTQTEGEGGEEERERERERERDRQTDREAKTKWLLYYFYYQFNYLVKIIAVHSYPLLILFCLAHQQPTKLKNKQEKRNSFIDRLSHIAYLCNRSMTVLCKILYN